MISHKEYTERLSLLSQSDRKFLEVYMANGFDAREAARAAKVQVPSALAHTYDLVEYIVHEEGTLHYFFNPWMIYSEYEKIYRRTTDDKVKLMILDKMTKLLKMDEDVKMAVAAESEGPAKIMISFK